MYSLLLIVLSLATSLQTLQHCNDDTCCAAKHKNEKPECSLLDRQALSLVLYWLV